METDQQEEYTYWLSLESLINVAVTRIKFKRKTAFETVVEAAYTLLAYVRVKIVRKNIKTRRKHVCHGKRVLYRALPLLPVCARWNRAMGENQLKCRERGLQITDSVLGECERRDPGHLQSIC
uniref:Lysine-specific demethylase 5B-B n=1 Tax=Schistocephalus solidus TaxID=70667 RepID=A0A0X3NIT0_SCHSO